MAKVKTSMLIEICNNLEEYNTFNKNFNEFISETKDYERDKKTLETLSSLQTLADGHNFFGKRKIKKFYNSNKEIIDKLNMINCEGFATVCDGIAKFIRETQIYYKKEYQPLCEYINGNKENIESILGVLTRLQELGFENIEFNESADFTQEIYTMNSKKRSNIRTIYFCENMEYIPPYDGIIKYRTSKSNYRIKKDAYYFNEFAPSIELNNLTFDSSSLPESVAYDYIYNGILALVNEQDHISYTNAINSGLTLNDINEKLKNLIKATKDLDLSINKLQSLEEREKLKEILLYMNLEIARMKQLEEQYKSEYHSENPQITEEVLRKERKWEIHL